MMRLQGLSGEELASLNLECLTKRQLGKLKGNAFSKTVVQRMLVQTMIAAEASV